MIITIARPNLDQPIINGRPTLLPRPLTDPSFAGWGIKI
jgi:hypothetical protein